MSKKQKIYNDQFKAEVIKLIKQKDDNVSATARKLGISMQTLSNWFNKANKIIQILLPLLEENKKMKNLLKIAEMEREFLKKAAAYFAKESQ
jgi:transposase